MLLKLKCKFNFQKTHEIDKEIQIETMIEIRWIKLYVFVVHEKCKSAVSQTME